VLEYKFDIESFIEPAKLQHCQANHKLHNYRQRGWWVFILYEKYITCETSKLPMSETTALNVGPAHWTLWMVNNEVQCDSHNI